MKAHFDVVVVAGGSSQRMGFDKLKAELEGETILERSVRSFIFMEEVERIMVVVPKARMQEWQEIFDSSRKDSYGDRVWERDIEVVEGGKERCLSVWNGLCALNEGKTQKWVAVHDGARPLVEPPYVRECLKAAIQVGGASCGLPIVDTLKRVDEGGNVVGAVDREKVWAMQTPQIFRRDILVDAYKKILEDGEMVTDEVSAVQRAGGTVKMVHGSVKNLKITFPDDLKLAELYLQQIIEEQEIPF